MTRTLVIVRHGNTFAAGEAPRRIGARTDLPLVPSGHEQARHLGAWFAQQGWRFDHVLCSPLRRTRETAEAIRAAQAGAPPVEASDLLVEIDHGVDEGRTEDEVVARIGAEALAAWDTRAEAPDGWTVDRNARITGWRSFLKEPKDDTVLLVTSNGAARFALLADPALVVQAGHQSSWKLRTGAFGIVQVTGDGARLVTWDQRPDQ